MRKELWSLAGGLLKGAARGGGGSVRSRTVEVGGQTFTYQLYVPAATAEAGGRPLVVFLHGINQRGEGGYLPAGGAPGALVRHYLGRVPAAVLLPQCRRGSYWTDPVMDEMVLKAVAQTEGEAGVDAARVYLAGVSMGGYGVWSLASRHAGRFAALVSVCGGSPLGAGAGDRFTPVARKVGATPAWLFHGAEDRVVPVAESRGMAAALKAAGADVRYSEYPGVGHDVWTKVLAERELMPWLLSRRLGAA